MASGYLCSPICARPAGHLRYRVARSRFGKVRQDVDRFAVFARFDKQRSKPPAGAGVIARYCEELFINRNGFLVFALFQVDRRQHVKAFGRLRLIFQPHEQIFDGLSRSADAVVIFSDFPITVVDARRKALKFFVCLDGFLRPIQLELSSAKRSRRVRLREIIPSASPVPRSLSEYSP